MRILVTGAAGTLGTALLPKLDAAGHELVALDIRPGNTEADWVIGDVRDAAAVSRAASGVDIVVHTAALHGIHLRDHSSREFYDLNLTGTFNVWQAAVDQRVKGVVFSSTMGVYGESRKPVGRDDVVFVDEALPLQPGDIYGWTKLAGEELCRYHLREHGIPSIALRYGMFVPEPFFRYGIRLLYGGVHEDDAAEAMIAALGAIERREVEHVVLNVESPLPFTAEDARDLRRDPFVALERYYPGAGDLLSDRGVSSLQPITEIFPVTQLEARLGLRPRHDFRAWLDELRTRPDERAPGNPPWP
jgi:UDP-glucose 4-epimerase